MVINVIILGATGSAIAIVQKGLGDTTLFAVAMAGAIGVYIAFFSDIFAQWFTSHIMASKDDNLDREQSPPNKGA